ncbi:Zinc finger protein [Morus notabilis]|uniref:Zinc finger protein n=1 Tax=Morus notabilis TaxID=981085 RepID=W9SHD6_9ROSA|nr:cytoplasmic 60S subunit biogenesis factor REI1 homolog 1 [Morus notabilis]XP_010111936.1 cytoplasmic 60S subunit biogenesis factor REI1 homolog 1 [Morus notabilis]EXB94240.1 Zinc finger protein [Morus notabilis]EXC32054.1 Zinc finger protein [Morus notabilis]
MPGLTCNACNKEFTDDSELKLHYKSEWHRYNLKRKVADVPGVTEALFLTRQSALAQEKNKLSETPMLYSCGLCGKGYRSSKAHAQHLQSRSHITRASHGTNHEDEERAIIKPLPRRVANKVPPQKEVESEESEDSEDEWVEVDPEEEFLGEATKSLTGLNVNEQGQQASEDDMDEDDDDKYEGLDPSCCFMCDLEHDTIESCMVHMHKQHGFFIPDVEYLKDPKGLLTYLGLKIKRDFMCLYCNDRRHPFSSLEAVRKHMVAKSHCKVHYGDGNDEEEVELEEFYDYSSSYTNEDGKQLVALGDAVELVGSELVITERSSTRISTKTIGSREFLRYYRQKPRPSPVGDMAITASLASRYRSMGLATVQSREQMVRMKVMKAMNRSGVEAMRTKIGMKSNVIRNLPKNVPY